MSRPVLLVSVRLAGGPPRTAALLGALLCAVAALAVTPSPPAPERDVPREEAIVRAHPNDLEALRRLAAAYADLADPRAEAIYRRLLKEAPDRPALRAELVDCLWKLGRIDDGNHEMDRLLQSAPRNVGLRRYYGTKLFDQGNFRKAETELDLVRRESPPDTDLLFYLGAARLENGRFPQAQQALEESIRLSPGNFASHHVLGEILLLQGRPWDAVGPLREATRLEPRSASAQMDLGNALAQSKDPAGAEEAFRSAIALDPGSPRAHYAIGTLLARLGRREEAAAEIALARRGFAAEQEANVAIGSRQAEISLARTLLAAGRADEALSHFRRYPEHREARLGAAEALSRLGRHAEAAEMLERALAISPEDRSIRWKLDREYAEASRH